MKKPYLCSLCAYRETPECSRFERLVLGSSSSSSPYLRYYREFKTLCIQGQKWWTEEEKNEALMELEKLERTLRERS